MQYLLGDTSTTHGALRAQNGRVDQWPVRYIDEDNISGGCSIYVSRFTQIYNAIHDQYPEIIVIASATSSSCLPSTLPSGVWTDIHHYEPPNAFVSLFNEWENWPRYHPIFVGDYASTTGTDGSATYWSNIQGSCGEAVYIIGLERNSVIVKMASFAPLLEYFDLAEWSVSISTSYSNVLLLERSDQTP